MERPLFIKTLADYRRVYPKEEHAIQMIALGPNGEVDVEYFEGNKDRGFMGNSITSYVYVNDWQVSFKRVEAWK